MYDVNSGGVQPCDTISKHAGKRHRFPFPARMSGSPHARPSIVRPGPRPRPAAAPVHGSGARDPATRAEDPGPSRHRSAPASALAARGNPESPRSISTRCGAFILSRD